MKKQHYKILLIGSIILTLIGLGSFLINLLVINKISIKSLFDLIIGAILVTVFLILYLKKDEE